MITPSTSAVAFFAGSATTTPAPATDLPAGITNVVAFRQGIAQNALTVTDDAGNIYSRVNNVATTQSGLDLWYARNTKAQLANVVVVHHNASTNRSVITFQIQGLISFPLDTSAVSASTISATPTTAPFSTVVASEILVVIGDQDTTGSPWSAPAGYTLVAQDSQNFLGMAYQVVNALQVGVTASLTSTDAAHAKRVIVGTFMGTSLPVTPYGVGTLVVPDADSNNGLFGTSFNAVTGALINQRLPLGAFAGQGSGEGGAQLSDGRFAVGGKGGQNDNLISVQIYDKTLTQIGLAYPLPFVAADVFSPMASDFSGRFWLADKNSRLAISFTPDGTISPTTYSLDLNPFAMGVTTDNGVMLYAADTAGSSINRWNLVSNTALGSLITPSPTAAWGEDLLVIPGTSMFVIIAQLDVSGVQFELRIYALADGSLLGTIPLPDDISNFSNARLTLDLGNPSRAIGLRTYTDPSGATTNILHLDLQAKTILSTVTLPMSGDATNPLAAPLSCPMFGWWPSLSPVRPGRPGCGG